MKTVTLDKRVSDYFRNNVNDKVGQFLSITFPKISANKWTTMGFLAALGASFFIVWRGLFWGSFAVMVSSSFDWIDGAVARARQKESRFGALLDDLTDRLGEFFYFIAIYLVRPSVAVLIAGFTSFLVSYVKADGERRGFTISYGESTGRSGRIILLIILMILSPWVSISSTLWLLAALNIFTIVRRGKEIYQQRPPQ